MFTKFVVMVAVASRAAPSGGEPMAASMAPGSALPETAHRSAPRAIPRMLVIDSDAKTEKPLFAGDAL